MRREKVFSKGGFYGFMVESNLLLHREAIENGWQAIKAIPAVVNPRRPVRVLDLACGGQPISIARMMALCPQVSFHYTGVDINPDQIEKANNEFVFPANVVKKNIFEADAWTLDYLPPAEPFDIIFIGMNLHHGTPPELLYLLRQINQLLAAGGVYINHDGYRPHAEPYKVRPATNPGNAAEKLDLVAPERLQDCASADAVLPNVSDTHDWRLPFTRQLAANMAELGADATSIESVVEHILERDYPVSAIEMQAIAKQSNLDASIFDYADSEAAMKGYYFMLVAHKAA